MMYWLGVLLIAVVFVVIIGGFWFVLCKAGGLNPWRLWGP